MTRGANRSRAVAPSPKHKDVRDRDHREAFGARASAVAVTFCSSRLGSGAAPDRGGRDRRRRRGRVPKIFDFLRDGDANRLVVVLVAIAVGVIGVFFVFWAMDQVVDWLPKRIGRLRPYVFVGPALVLLSVFLI